MGPLNVPGVEERIDPSTGRTFYIDHVNKRTTWEDPRQVPPAACGDAGRARRALPHPLPSRAHAIPAGH
eukprot:scaffold1585_cov96-Isochrysis_galbana.AAC.1